MRSKRFGDRVVDEEQGRDRDETREVDGNPAESRNRGLVNPAAITRHIQQFEALAQAAYQRRYY